MLDSLARSTHLIMEWQSYLVAPKSMTSLLRGRIQYAIAVCVTASVSLAACVSGSPDGPYQATGIKIGEVTGSSATIWTRLTRDSEREQSAISRPSVQYVHPETGELVDPPPWPQTPADWVPIVQLPQSITVDDLEGAVPGATGEIQVLYRSEGAADWQSTGWQSIDPKRDFTQQFQLTQLTPDTAYAIRVEGRHHGSNVTSTSVEGGFRTAPRPDQPARIVFASVTGQDYINKDLEDGYKIYRAMLELDLDFFVHTGDILYYDSWAKNLELARWGWAQMFSLPTNFAFHRQVPTYFMKDDHDTWLNDAWPSQQSRFMGDFTFAQGQAVFLEQVPIASERTYRTFRWGQDLQIWLAEARDFRDPNPAPDGPQKTMWGAEQIAWFIESVEASDATFRILISPTPLTGPYQNSSENDNHTNLEGFAHEGRVLRNFLAQQANMIVICGDRHYQYVIDDPETGIREYATGPASDEHARGWSNDDVRPEHRYLNLVGGFLTATVERQDDAPMLMLQHYGVDGQILNEETIIAE